MEVSTSFCTQAVSFKYGSFKESDDVMMEDEMYNYGSYGSDGFLCGDDGGSVGEEMASSSGGGIDEEDFGDYFEEDEIEDHQEMMMTSQQQPQIEQRQDQKLEPVVESDDEDEEMRSESDMTEDLADENDEDEDEEDNDEWTNQKRNDNRNSVAYYAAMEMLRIRFPFQSISIRISDFCCLQEKDLLNDTMIDFYLNHIVEHILPDNIGRKVTVLPSVFWHNLSLRQHVIDPEEAATMSWDAQLETKFRDLHDFVEDFDLHDFDYIVMPVNEWEHWSLVVICHPFTPLARTLIFDSQMSADFNNHQNVAALTEQFMQYMWLKRTGKAYTQPMKCVIPQRLPQQSNNFDCGVFIVEFARRFLMNPPKDLDSFDFLSEYEDFNIAGKRTEMQKAVLSLCSNRARWRPLVELLNGINTAAPHRAL